jgi:redox-sensitive bicupin YhaK (pirin superfamily)
MTEQKMDETSPVTELVIPVRQRDLGGFSVRRALPSAERRLVGPFIFLDHVGPVSFPLHQGLDVRPHPHIGLATVTYLFEGEFLHRDSLGFAQQIRPGDVNWMIAGRGITHSERTPSAQRDAGARLHGIQSWVALPTAHEEDAPSFEHHPASTLPEVELKGAKLRVIAGTSYGVTAPTKVLSPTLYVHARLEAGALFPIDESHAERAIYIAEGSIRCDGTEHSAGTLLVLRPGKAVVEATQPAQLMLVGGAPLDGPRHIYWNFVSSSEAKIIKAAEAWRAGLFPKVPGDEHEFIPLPEGP